MVERSGRVGGGGWGAPLSEESKQWLAMEARGRDTELLSAAGLKYGSWQGVLNRQVVLDGPLLAPLPRLEWSGWDYIAVSIAAGAEALESTAAALPSLRCLVVKYDYSRPAKEEATLSAVAAVLRRYPMEEFHFTVRTFLVARGLWCMCGG